MGARPPPARASINPAPRNRSAFAGRDGKPRPNKRRRRGLGAWGGVARQGAAPPRAGRLPEEAWLRPGRGGAAQLGRGRAQRARSRGPEAAEGAGPGPQRGPPGPGRGDAEQEEKYNARFPPARIKKIMQTDEEIGKVAAAVPVIISRALELFLESLLRKACHVTQSRNAKTMTTSHLSCIELEQQFDFLKDLVAAVPDMQGEGDEPHGEGERGGPRRGRRPGARGGKNGGPGAKGKDPKQSGTDSEQEEDSEDSDSDGEEEPPPARPPPELHQPRGPLRAAGPPRPPGGAPGGGSPSPPAPPAPEEEEEDEDYDS
ncbi:LOW QUALITY PROTEIN: dr1-associated corepressor [Opisthocomus hoazin]|uniref:LOW QUALITY PROTEIN: dr1-associated corepressor n=1 Tax=Opisthocomus hoazin TaxID=30419 RepID=UPI003F53313B